MINFKLGATYIMRIYCENHIYAQFRPHNCKRCKDAAQSFLNSFDLKDSSKEKEEKK